MHRKRRTPRREAHEKPTALVCTPRRRQRRGPRRSFPPRRSRTPSSARATSASARLALAMALVSRRCCNSRANENHGNSKLSKIGSIYFFALCSLLFARCRVESLRNECRRTLGSGFRRPGGFRGIRLPTSDLRPPTSKPKTAESRRDSPRLAESYRELCFSSDSRSGVNDLPSASARGISGCVGGGGFRGDLIRPPTFKRRLAETRRDSPRLAENSTNSSQRGSSTRAETIYAPWQNEFALRCDQGDITVKSAGPDEIWGT